MAGASWSLARPRRCSPSRPRYVADQIARAGRGGRADQGARAGRGGGRADQIARAGRGGRAEPPAIRRKRSIRRQRQFRRMDDAKFGAACRAVRVPKHLIQAAVAEAAGVRRSIGGRPPGGWRAGGHVTRDGAQGASCSRDVDGHHTALARVGPGPDHQPRPAVIQESVLRRLAAVPGWIGVPEVSFSICGERGAIDILGGTRPPRTLLIVELKTLLVDPDELVRTMDQRVRLGKRFARDRGWPPSRSGANRPRSSRVASVDRGGTATGDELGMSVMTPLVPGHMSGPATTRRSGRAVTDGFWSRPLSRCAGPSGPERGDTAPDCRETAGITAAPSAGPVEAASGLPEGQMSRNRGRPELWHRECACATRVPMAPPASLRDTTPRARVTPPDLQAHPALGCHPAPGCHPALARPQGQGSRQGPDCHRVPRSTAG
jgi:hypothetical protein